MADSSDSLTTYEIARQCPKCGLYGELTRTDPGPRRSKIETYTCENEVCPWYGTGWVVQINSDGSIPERKQGGVKAYPELPDAQRQAYDDYFKRLEAEDGKGR